VARKAKKSCRAGGSPAVVHPGRQAGGSPYKYPEQPERINPVDGVVLENDGSASLQILMNGQQSRVRRDAVLRKWLPYSPSIGTMRMAFYPEVFRGWLYHGNPESVRGRLSLHPRRHRREIH